MPGGVNSPVRAFKSVGGQPIIFDRVKGSKAWDVDGNQYVDYIGSWGPAIIGACDDEVRYLLITRIVVRDSPRVLIAFYRALLEVVIRV